MEKNSDSYQQKYDQVISGRVTTQDKELMKANGYNVRDAVTYLLNNKSSRETKLQVKKILIEKEINNLEEELQIKKLQHEQILMDLGITTTAGGK